MPKKKKADVKKVQKTVKVAKKSATRSKEPTPEKPLGPSTPKVAEKPMAANPALLKLDPSLDRPLVIHDENPSVSDVSPKPDPDGIAAIVAVMGDVAADWAFVSESSEAQGSQFQPWKNYKSTHLFSFPGGAWFTGHMVEAALEGPRFSRNYKATIEKSQELRIEGELVLQSEKEQWRLSPMTPDSFFEFVIRETDINICQNDETILLRVKKSDLQIRAIVYPEEGQLDFNCEYETAPGSIRPNQLNRCFDVSNMRISSGDGKGLKVNYVEIKGNPTLLYSGTSRQDGASSVRCYKESSTPGGPRVEQPFYVARWIDSDTTPDAGPISAVESVFTFKTAFIDVIHGDLKVNVDIRDQGKLRTDTKPEWTPLLEVRPDYRLIPQREQMPGELNSFRKKTALWLYANPGRALSMQEPKHIIHTLSELEQYKAYPDSDAKHQVYRRRTHHGVEGPQGHLATILKHYRPYLETPELVDNSIQRLVIIDDDGLGFSECPDSWKPFLPEPHREVRKKLMERARRKVIAQLTKDDATGDDWFEKANLEPIELDVTDEKRALEFKEALWRSKNARLDKRVQRLSELLVEKEWERLKASTKRLDLQSTWIIFKASHWIAAEKSPLLQMIRESGLAERCIIVVSGDTLRHGLEDKRHHKPGVKLARRASWERTYDEFLTAVGSSKLKPILLSCRHFLVRLDLDAVLHFEREEPATNSDSSTSAWVVPKYQDYEWTPQGNVQLVFDHQLCEGEYADTAKHGEFPGLTAVFVAALTRTIHRHWIKNPGKPGFPVLNEGIQYALNCCRRYFDLGYGPRIETIRRFEDLQLPIVQVFGDAALDVCRNSGQHKFATYSSRFAAPLLGHEPAYWSILGSRLQSRSGSSSTVTGGYAALRLARDIVRSGTEEVLRKYPEKFPIARFRNLTVVDRREIEGLRSIKNILEEYLSQKERGNPLSFAVFGPPGSGKSFGVREIAQAMARGNDIQDFTFNLAQFSSFAEVTQQLLRVRDAGLENRLPLVFFDEFDTEFDKRPLGWLKYFLAPMQDGKFQHGETMLGIGRAILVFAGGVAASHDEFNDKEFWQKKYPEIGASVFQAAKGPDFHSRLRGFLNIVGPNPSVSASVPNVADSDEDFVYVIRRAMLIRQSIVKEAKSGAALLDNRQQADLDNDVLDALLLTDEYKHGVRSVQAILEMSALHKQQRISKSSLPAWDQCAMHVDQTFRHILWREYSRLRTPIRDILERQDRDA